MGDTAVTATLKPDTAYALTIKRMPAITNDNFCPDMGRMTAR
jgi:hypothetical protein